VIFGDIERLEIVVVGFHFRPFDHIKAHLGKDAADTVGNLGNGVKGSLFRHPTRQGDIDAVGCLLGDIGQTGQRILEFAFEGSLYFIGPFTRLGPLLGGQA
jgi:hypothetical protein